VSNGTLRGLSLEEVWQSDSGFVDHLDEVSSPESFTLIQRDEPPFYGPDTPSPDILTNMVSPPNPDLHAMDISLVRNYREGEHKYYQYVRFICKREDLQTILTVNTIRWYVYDAGAQGQPDWKLGLTITTGCPGRPFTVPPIGLP